MLVIHDEAQIKKMHYNENINGMNRCPNIKASFGQFLPHPFFLLLHF
jgi:hypothetical protein